MVFLALFTYVSATCSVNTTYKVGKTKEYHMHYQERNFGKTKRFYYLDIPEDYDPSKKYTVLFYFHGHGGHGFPQNFVDQARKMNWISVYPQGLADDPAKPD